MSHVLGKAPPRGPPRCALPGLSWEAGRVSGITSRAPLQAPRPGNHTPASESPRTPPPHPPPGLSRSLAVGHPVPKGSLNGGADTSTKKATPFWGCPWAPPVEDGVGARGSPGRRPGSEAGVGAEGGAQPGAVPPPASRALPAFPVRPRRSARPVPHDTASATNFSSPSCRPTGMENGRLGAEFPARAAAAAGAP